MNINLDLSLFMKELNNNCSKVQKKSFKKGEVITSYIAKRNQLCLLLSVEADLIRYDLNGNRTIVEHFSNKKYGKDVSASVFTNKFSRLFEHRQKCYDEGIKIVKRR